MHLLVVGVGDFATGFQSGRPRAVLQAARQLGDVTTLELPGPPFIERAIARGLFLAAGRPLSFPERSRNRLSAYARALRRATREALPDVIVSTTTFPFWEAAEAPAIAWPDATLHGMVSEEEYVFSQVPRGVLLRALRNEDRLITGADILALPTKRASDSVPSSKPVQAPFGPNLPDQLLRDARVAREQTSQHRHKRSHSRMALFIGKDWLRKGGDIAVASLARARELGLDIGLQVIGSAVTGDTMGVPVDQLGALDPDTEAGASGIVRALSTADILFLPGRHDNFGAVIAEAAAVGLPVVTTDRVGAAEYVREHDFGRVVPGDDTHLPDTIGRELVDLFQDEPTLIEFEENALRCSRTTLDYGRSLAALIARVQG